MTQTDLIKQLKSILCWVQRDSTANIKLKELIVKLGGRIDE